VLTLRYYLLAEHADGIRYHLEGDLTKEQTNALDEATITISNILSLLESCKSHHRYPIMGPVPFSLFMLPTVLYNMTSHHPHAFIRRFGMQLISRVGR